MEQGIPIRIIDGDIGQADIGPPTTTSSSIVSRGVYNLQELNPEKIYFIGDTSPSSVQHKHVKSISRLKQEYSKDNLVTLVNTDGWIREEKAIAHKIELLNSLRPNLVLGLSTDHELDPILELQHFPVMRLEASKFSKTRTRDERRKMREEGYKRFLQNSQNMDLRISKIKLRMFNQPQQQRIDQASAHRGTLAGLLDDSESLLSIGRIVEVRNEIIRIRTATREKPTTVELGAVVLSSTFREVGFES